jgi:NAD(P)-dependent dehydrogenase (short-subunit alcohol dehydrogenase family)
MKLQGKIAIVVGAGQTPGPNLGTGKAASLLYAKEGCRVFAVDRSLAAAQETVDAIRSDGGEAEPFAADATIEEDVRAMVEACVNLWGRIDILHNNVGASLGAGDGPLSEITSESFDRVIAVNLKTGFLTSKYAVAVMRKQESGVIINISSLAAVIECPNIVYKAAKAAVNALTTQTAIENAQYGIRVNAIMPGQISTSMLIENRVGRAGATREDVEAAFDAIVPLRRKMASAWEVAKAAVFLASDDASFITGALLPVDGGQGLQIGGQGLRIN